ncbi:hypothetical protein J437_LFUL003653 [Ladona fulva]|uniref:Heparan-alpha-glucosaminide N-acetyltransferase catalytic domain-containing protein n=1 Tax=Ladona fulva TaxID=123851 RepID=A0A8K0P0C9_LADFU|nr:hypothetical protein J437_LFUL003653 [Ladona fulva]
MLSSQKNPSVQKRIVSSIISTITMGSWVEHPNVDVYDGHDLSKLDVDQARLKLTSNVDRILYLYSLSEDCYKCPYTSLSSIPANSYKYITVDTKHDIEFQIYGSNSHSNSLDENNSILCDLKTIGSASRMGEFGVYELNVNGSYPDSLSCSIQTLVEPVNIYLPILLIVLIIIGGLLACILSSKVLNYLRNNSTFVQKFIKPENKQSEVVDTNGTARRKRVKSLDTFRGISIVLMIFVNDGAGGYWFMEHATWNGLQIADLLFPWFMWIMGVCIPISMRGILKRAEPIKSVLLNIFRRSATMFLLGLMLNTAYGGANMNNLRIFGVLQRFGVSYCIIAAIAFLLAPSNGYQPTKKEDIEENGTCEMKVSKMQRILNKIPEVISLKLQWGIIGYLGPGGIQNGGIAKDCIGGATGFIDQSILGKSHIYQNPTSRLVYKSGPFDPEGLFGCLLSVFQVFLGVQAGVVLLFHSSHKARLIRWLSWAVITGAIGMNAIVMYVGHSLGFHHFPWHWSITGIMNTHFVLTIEALWGTGLWVIIASILYQKKTFITI